MYLPLKHGLFYNAIAVLMRFAHAQFNLKLLINLRPVFDEFLGHFLHAEFQRFFGFAVYCQRGGKSNTYPIKLCPQLLHWFTGGDDRPLPVSSPVGVCLRKNQPPAARTFALVYPSVSVFQA